MMTVLDGMIHFVGISSFLTMVFLFIKWNWFPKTEKFVVYLDDLGNEWIQEGGVMVRWQE